MAEQASNGMEPHKTFVNTLVFVKGDSDGTTGSLDSSLMAWNETTLAELGASTLLSYEDVEKLKTCAPAIRHAFNKTQMFRTRTEMDISVLNDVKFPTPDSKYWQSVREMNVMVENLIMISFNFKRKMLDLKEKENALETLEKTQPDSVEETIARERLIVDVEQTRFEIAVIQREAHHRIREIDQWRDIQNTLIPTVAAGTDDVDNHQLLSYAIRFLREYQIAAQDGAGEDNSVDAVQNQRAHIMTVLRVITDRGLSTKLIAILSQDKMLFDFLQKKNIIRVEKKV